MFSSQMFKYKNYISGSLFRGLGTPQKRSIVMIHEPFQCRSNAGKANLHSSSFAFAAHSKAKMRHTTRLNTRVNPCNGDVLPASLNGIYWPGRPMSGGVVQSDHTFLPTFFRQISNVRKKNSAESDLNISPFSEHVPESPKTIHQNY